MKPSGKKKVPSINGPESFLDKGKQKIETEEEDDEDSQGEEEEDDGEGGEEEEQESESVKEISKLDDEFYEIENVRKKRTTRKGEVLYLIKWRGWPETANTWEPIDNLQSCPELIEAFEERFSRLGRKRRRKTHFSSKKKRATPVFHFHANSTISEKGHHPTENRICTETATGTIGSQADVVVNTKVREEEDEEVRSDVTAKGEEGEEPISTSVRSTNVATDSGNCLTRFGADKNTNEVKPAISCELVANSNKEGNEGGISINFQDIGPSTSPENGDNGSVNKANMQNGRISGAKKRKSGNVRRFKRDSTGLEQKEFNSTNGSEPYIDKDGSPPTESMEGERGNSLKDMELPSSIHQIIKAVSYTTSTIDKVQKVAVSFKALRSDGKEVMVDNEYLKTNNPLLLIDFYEQHLRYSPV